MVTLEEKFTFVFPSSFFSGDNNNSLPAKYRKVR
jgi:hypothetical protein